MSGTKLALYWILILAVGGFGTFMWWKSGDDEYVESLQAGSYKSWLVAYQNMPRWLAPVLVPLGIVGMVVVTFL